MKTTIPFGLVVLAICLLTVGDASARGGGGGGGRGGGGVAEHVVEEEVARAAPARP